MQNIPGTGQKGRQVRVGSEFLDESSPKSFHRANLPRDALITFNSQGATPLLPRRGSYFFPQKLHLVLHAKNNFHVKRKIRLIAR